MPTTPPNAVGYTAISSTAAPLQHAALSGMHIHISALSVVRAECTGVLFDSIYSGAYAFVPNIPTHRTCRARGRVRER